MGYKIGLTAKRKNGLRSWRVFHVDKTKQRTVKTSEYSQLGLSTNLNYEQAKAVLRSLNKDSHHKRIERAKNVAQVRVQETENAVLLYLPKAFTTEFEQESFGDGENSTAARYWEASKRCIADLKMGIEVICKNPKLVYRYCQKKQYSLSYTKKIIFTLNLYGKWWSAKVDKAYLAIPSPRGVEQERISDTYLDSGKQTKESAPLTPENLTSKKNVLSAEHYNWLFISVWLGLRPHEIDELKKKQTWAMEETDGMKVLLVYQSKLSGIPRDKRWKYIPLFFKEQLKALEIINSGEFKRPLVKTVRLHLGQGVTCYGGRKGFVDLMLKKGRKFTEVSVWLGHQTLDQTFKAYKDKKKVFIEK